jgi:hypothetical protein
MGKTYINTEQWICQVNQAKLVEFTNWKENTILKTLVQSQKSKN